MTAELRSVKTNAEQALADAYQASKAKLPGGRKVVALREAAAAPGSLPFADANAVLSAVSAAVLIGRISAFMTPSLPDIARSPRLRARAQAPCRRS